MTDQDHGPQRRPITEGLHETFQKLGDIPHEFVVPPDKQVTGIIRVDYRSPAIQRLGVDTADRSVTTITFNDGCTCMVVYGRAETTPSEWDQDLSILVGPEYWQTDTAVYLHDGQDTLTEIMPTGEVQHHTGDAANLDTLLYWIGNRMGLASGVETFG